MLGEKLNARVTLREFQGTKSTCYPSHVLLLPLIVQGGPKLTYQKNGPKLKYQKSDFVCDCLFLRGFSVFGGIEITRA